MAIAVPAAAIHAAASGRDAAAFASAIEQLSEPEGAFDTDNLISNERGYLRVIPSLVSGGVTGGAYIGVGPDQNFSYIARIRPSVAYIIDIRRDNLLLHLLFKGVFARSTTRVAYLSHLTGRAPPSDLARWKNSSIREIAAYIDGQKTSSAGVAEFRRQLDATISGFGVKLSQADLKTIERFHRAFVDDGLELQFHSFGRAPQPYYPTLRDLLLATDGRGRPWNYLASEEDFQFLKSMEATNAIIPVVGDIAGTHAMPAIAEAITAQGLKLSAFYISNIETYIARNGTFPQFIENAARLPRDEHSVIIRSIFGGAGSSTSSVEPLDRVLAGSISPGRIR